MISFAKFLSAVDDDAEREPYPWQQRFADRCVAGSPPALVGVPTGCGKTTVVDALVWALATQAKRPHAERTVGVRIVWAIDRRILVDEVHEHAKALAERLLLATDHPGDPLHEVASQLADLSGAVPLVATRWRGGLPAERALHPPNQAQIITSTVAQIGSRLLFRGYGVGRGSLSVAAGLAACDTTICLDEAHLAEPFRQTVGAIRDRRADTERELELPGLGLITLTATPSGHLHDAILLDDEDRQVPELKRRLKAAKTARLEEARATERERVALIAERAAGYLYDGAPTVACVVNTVKRAREVFDLLKRDLRDDADVALMIGPQRPADRERMLARHGAHLFGRDAPAAQPLVVVATQTFEVGLDADVAAMVTDSASAAALVQRLGRLNRSGLGVGRVTIVRDESSWLYGDDEPLAWRWLSDRARDDGLVDVSVGALESDQSRPRPTKVRGAPSLTPGVLELLAQTNPPPGPWQEPSVESFLRGAEDQTSTDLTVCWRCDLLPTVDDAAAQGYREMLLQLVPLQPAEQLTLSVKAARALIAALYPGASRPAKAATLAISDVDVEGEGELARIPDPASDSAAPFLVIRRGEVRHGSAAGGRDGRIAPSALQPGDAIVLPSRAGGVDEHGLAPSAKPHADFADVAGDRKRSARDASPAVAPVPVRLSPAALGVLDQGDWREIGRQCRRITDGPPTSNTAELVDDLIENLSRRLPEREALSILTRRVRSELDQPIHVLLRAIGPVDESDLPILDEDEVQVLDGEPGSAEGIGELANSDRQENPSDRAELGEDEVLERTWVLVPVADREREHRDSANPPPTLERHATAVRSQVEAFVAASGLPDAVRSALSLAAAVHDHGKADPRTQAFFHGGVRPFGAELIAKSVFGTADPRTERLARVTSGLPRGLRHEVASVAVFDSWLAGGTHHDRGSEGDLVRHLVGVHHGQGRPIPRLPMGGDDPVPFSADAAGVSGTAIGDAQDGWAEGEWLQRFWRVIDRYGEWGTAYLEALLVLADRTVSARGD